MIFRKGKLVQLHSLPLVTKRITKDHLPAIVRNALGKKAVVTKIEGDVLEVQCISGRSNGCTFLIPSWMVKTSVPLPKAAKVKARQAMKYYGWLEWGEVYKGKDEQSKEIMGIYRDAFNAGVRAGYDIATEEAYDNE